MTRVVAKEVSVILLLCLGVGISAFFVAQQAYWRYLPCDDVYRPIALNEHSIELINNDFLRVYRKWISGDDRPITITRALMCVGADGKTFNVPLQTSVGSHKAGADSQVIRVDIPHGVPAGHCEYVSRVSWSCSPLREQFVDLPPLPVDLTSTSK